MLWRLCHDNFILWWKTKNNHTPQSISIFINFINHIFYHIYQPYLSYIWYVFDVIFRYVIYINQNWLDLLLLPPPLHLIFQILIVYHSVNDFQKEVYGRRFNPWLVHLFLLYLVWFMSWFGWFHVINLVWMVDGEKLKRKQPIIRFHSFKLNSQSHLYLVDEEPHLGFQIYIYYGIYYYKYRCYDLISW